MHKNQKTLREQAEKLAARPYTRVTFEDELSDGSGKVWIAMHPELEGSIAQGDTEREAIENLKEVRVSHIYSLLRRGFSVPEPAVAKTTVTSSFVWMGVFNASPDRDHELEVAFERTTDMERIAETLDIPQLSDQVPA